MVGGIDVWIGIRWVGERASGYKWAAVILVSILALAYAAIVGVALFHPDERRRADARLLLKNHRFSRKPPRSRSDR